MSGLVGPGFSWYQYSTFSGADIVCSITVPVLTNNPVTGTQTFVSGAITIGNLQTVSISTHRDKFPVRACGSINPRGFTRSCRTIAGSLIFTMFDRDALTEVRSVVQAYLQQVNINYSLAVGNVSIPNMIQALLVDELPPFDITITMINDNGMAAIAKIIGVEIVDMGHVMGIDDLYIEETMSFSAAEFFPIFPIAPGTVSSNSNTGTMYPIQSAAAQQNPPIITQGAPAASANLGYISYTPNGSGGYTSTYYTTSSSGASIYYAGP